MYRCANTEEKVDYILARVLDSWKRKNRDRNFHAWILSQVKKVYLCWWKYLKSPIIHSIIPTTRDSNIASSVYNSVDESAMLPSTLETKRETNATGPTASWREDPNMAYTNRGTKPESSLQREITSISRHYTKFQDVKHWWCI